MSPASPFPWRYHKSLASPVSRFPAKYSSSSPQCHRPLVSVLGFCHSRAMLHKEGEIFPGLRSRTAHMVSHKAIWAIKQRSIHTIYHPISRLRCIRCPLWALSRFSCLNQISTSIDPNSYPCSRSIVVRALSIPPFHPGTLVTSTRPVPRPREAILGPETVLGPNFPYLLLLLFPSHPLLLAKQSQHILSILSANTKKLVDAGLSLAVRTSHSIQSENSCLAFHH